MDTISLTLAIMCLVMIAWEDFAERQVHWSYFPILAGAGGVHAYEELHSMEKLAMYAGCNLAFLMIQFLLLKSYFFIRQTAMVSIIDRKIGWGDILFLLAAAFFFSPLNFIWFYLSSLLFSLMVSLLWSTYRRSALRSIPLAGLQSVFLLLFIGAANYLHHSLVR
jgi:hypothetical protein